MNTDTLTKRPTRTLREWVRAAALAAAILAAVGLLGLAPRALHADPAAGPLAQHTTVLSGHDDVYHVRYNGSEQGDAHVLADDDYDDRHMEIKVYDPEGTLVTRDFGDADHSPHCSWDVGAEWDWRVYTIKVVNFSDHDIPYTLHCF